MATRVRTNPIGISSKMNRLKQLIIKKKSSQIQDLIDGPGEFTILCNTVKIWCRSEMKVQMKPPQSSPLRTNRDGQSFVVATLKTKNFCKICYHGLILDVSLIVAHQ